MALVRILVDGYSLLHDWPELAPGMPRFSAAAREELIQRLGAYQDTSHTPITIFFDGSQPRGSRSSPGGPHPVEVLYSHQGQTADQMIERAAHRFREYGEVMAVTNDIAERETVTSLGGLACSCLNFINMVDGALVELRDEIKHHNLKERNRFNRRRQ